MKPSHALAGAIAVALLVAGALVMRQGDEPESGVPKAAAAMPPVSPPTNASSAPAAPRGAPMRPAAVSAAASAEDLATIARFAQWDAKSVEEARWLEQHGYPDAETAERYQGLSDEALAALAAGGDALARLVRAERSAYRDGGTAAIDEMFAVAADGSIYALERLALAQGNGRYGDAGMMEAYLQAARLRGNYAAPVPEEGISSPDQRAMSHAMAQAILDRLNLMRSQRGLPPLGIDARPGAGVTFEQLFIDWQSRMATPPSQ